MEDRQAQYFSRPECPAFEELNVFSYKATRVNRSQRVTAPEPIDIRTVEPGTRLKLLDDSVVEVTQNPADGY